MSHAPNGGPVAALRQFFGVPLRSQTYRNLAYLALAFPLGTAYFVGLSVGLSAGLGLAVTLVGLPVLVVTVAAAVGAASFEAKLATWLLDVEATPPAALGELDDSLDSVGALVDTVKGLFTNPTTWSGLLLVVLKFVFGVAAFTALVTAGSIAVSLLAAPLAYDTAAASYSVGPYAVDTLTEALGLSGAGVLVTLVSLHLLNGLAKLGGFTTAALLGDDVEHADGA
jgi:hypothetical protein